MRPSWILFLVLAAMLVPYFGIPDRETAAPHLLARQQQLAHGNYIIDATFVVRGSARKARSDRTNQNPTIWLPLPVHTRTAWRETNRPS